MKLGYVSRRAACSALFVIVWSSASAANRPISFQTICAEGKTCTVAAGTEVAFGRTGQFVRKVLSGNFTCEAATFATPRIPGGINECSVAAQGTTAPGVVGPLSPVIGLIGPALSSSLSSSSSSAALSSSSQSVRSPPSSATPFTYLTETYAFSAPSKRGGFISGGDTGTANAVPPRPDRPQLATELGRTYSPRAALLQAGKLGALVTERLTPADDIIVFDLLTNTDDLPISYVVSKTGGGTHTSIQAAVNAAVASGATNRQLIKIMPGTYEELVIIPKGANIGMYGVTSLDTSGRKLLLTKNFTYVTPVISLATAANFGRHVEVELTGFDPAHFYLAMWAQEQASTRKRPDSSLFRTCFL